MLLLLLGRFLVPEDPETTIGLEPINKEGERCRRKVSPVAASEISLGTCYARDIEELQKKLTNIQDFFPFFFVGLAELLRI